MSLLCVCVCVYCWINEQEIEKTCKEQILVSNLKELLVKRGSEAAESGQDHIA